MRGQYQRSTSGKKIRIGVGLTPKEYRMLCEISEILDLSQSCILAQAYRYYLEKLQFTTEAVEPQQGINKPV